MEIRASARVISDFAIDPFKGKSVNDIAYRLEHEPDDTALSALAGYENWKGHRALAFKVTKAIQQSDQLRTSAQGRRFLDAIAKSGVLTKLDKAQQQELFQKAVDTGDVELALSLTPEPGLWDWFVKGYRSKPDVLLGRVVDENLSTLVGPMKRRGISLEGPDPENTRVPTPLYRACQQGNSAVALELVKHGATNRDTMDQGFSVTPLMAACGTTGMDEVAVALLERGAAFDMVDPRYGEPLFFTAYGADSYEALGMMLDSVSDPQARDRDGHTILTLAAFEDDTEGVRVALESGRVDVNATVEMENRKTGQITSKSALELAVASDDRNPELVELLAEGGAALGRPSLRTEFMKSEGPQAAALVQDLRVLRDHAVSGGAGSQNQRVEVGLAAIALEAWGGDTDSLDDYVAHALDRAVQLHDLDGLVALVNHPYLVSKLTDEHKRQIVQLLPRDQLTDDARLALLPYFSPEEIADLGSSISGEQRSAVLRREVMWQGNATTVEQRLLDDPRGVMASLDPLTAAVVGRRYGHMAAQLLEYATPEQFKVLVPQLSPGEFARAFEKLSVDQKEQARASALPNQLRRLDGVGRETE